MNKVTIDEVKEEAHTVQGQLYTGPDETVYILARLDSDAFSLVSLISGNRWTEPVPLSKLCLDEFTKLTDGSIVTIEVG